VFCSRQSRSSWAVKLSPEGHFDRHLERSATEGMGSVEAHLNEGKSDFYSSRLKTESVLQVLLSIALVLRGCSACSCLYTRRLSEPVYSLPLPASCCAFTWQSSWIFRRSCACAYALKGLQVFYSITRVLRRCSARGCLQACCLIKPIYSLCLPVLLCLREQFGVYLN